MCLQARKNTKQSTQPNSTHYPRASCPHRAAMAPQNEPLRSRGCCTVGACKLALAVEGAMRMRLAWWPVEAGSYLEELARFDSTATLAVFFGGCSPECTSPSLHSISFTLWEYPTIARTAGGRVRNSCSMSPKLSRGVGQLSAGLLSNLTAELSSCGCWASVN